MAIKPGDRLPEAVLSTHIHRSFLHAYGNHTYTRTFRSNHIEFGLLMHC